MRLTRFPMLAVLLLAVACGSPWIKSAIGAATCGIVATDSDAIVEPIVNGRPGVRFYIAAIVPA